MTKTPAKKVFDVSKPKKTAPGATSRPLIVSSRPLIKQDPMVVEDTAKPSEPTTAPTVSRRVSIKPITLDETGPAGEPVDQTVTEPAAKDESVPEVAAEVASPVVTEEAADEPKVDTADAPTEPEEAAEPSTDKPVADEPAPEQPTQVDSKDTDGGATAEIDQPASPEPSQEAPVPTNPDAEAQKAAEAEAKRQQELQQYVDNREFFVPINAVERKRSIKVSIGLTLLLIVLSIALIDLMLDAGIILLLEKIPHTNFFRVMN